MQKNKFNVKLFVLLPLVLAITIFLWAVPTSFYGIEFLTATQQRVIALFVFAALMWMFEIIPNWTTSLLIIVFSLLIVSDKGIGFLCTPDAGQLVPYKSIMSAFADPVVMLFLGGFVLANMATKYGLDVTLARFLLKPFKKSWSVLLAFLVVVALLSMFMSNTATAAMMLALLTPVLRGLPDDDKGKVGLALSIPVAANVGGIGTTIGTPPNATAVKFLGEAGFDVTFASWAAHMIPYVLVMIIVAWVILMILFPFKTKELRLDIKPSSRKTDWKTIVVWVTFFGTILLWATEQITHISSNVRKAALTADGSPQGETPLKEEKLMSAETCAMHLAKALARRKSQKILTAIGKLTVVAHNLFPRLTDRLTYSYIAREAGSPFK